MKLHFCSALVAIGVKLPLCFSLVVKDHEFYFCCALISNIDMKFDFCSVLIAKV